MQICLHCLTNQPKMVVHCCTLQALGCKDQQPSFRKTGGGRCLDSAQRRGGRGGVKFKTGCFMNPQKVVDKRKAGGKLAKLGQEMPFILQTAYVWPLPCTRFNSSETAGGKGIHWSSLIWTSQNCLGIDKIISGRMKKEHHAKNIYPQTNPQWQLGMVA